MFVSSLLSAQWTGAGTESDPHPITSRADLDRLAQEVNGGNSFAGKYFKVMNDIDMSVGFTTADSAFIPIGLTSSTGQTFQGVFDGDSRIISNLCINVAHQNHIGFFGYIAMGGPIKNVRLADVDITSSGSSVGALASASNVDVINCYASGTVRNTVAGSAGGLLGHLGERRLLKGCHSDVHVHNDAPDTIAASFTGGMVGAMSPATIRNCTVGGLISGHGYLGGLVGYCSAYNNDTLHIDNCHVSASIRAAASSMSASSGYVGGIIGRFYPSNSQISNCSFSGTLDGTSANNVGGIVGIPSSRTKLENLSVSGSISGQTKVGGIAAQTMQNCIMKNVIVDADVTGEIEHTGGIVGYVYRSEVSDCEFRGSVAGDKFVGGIAGYCDSSTVFRANAFASTVDGMNYVGGAFGSIRGSMLEQCQSRGDVAGTDRFIGGFAGYVSYGKDSTFPSTVRDCYATGDVDIATGNYGGGFAGVARYSTIENGYAAGHVNGSPDSAVAAFIGVTDTMTVRNCYADTQRNPAFMPLANGAEDGITAQTTAFMQSFELPELLNDTRTVPLWFASVPSYNHGYPAFTEQRTRPPVFSVPSGEYDSCVVLQITSPTADAVIHYTLDGTMPDTRSAILHPYESLHINDITTVTAIAVAPGLSISPAVTEIYTFITPDSFLYVDDHAIRSYQWSDTESRYVAPHFAALSVLSSKGDTIRYTTFDTDVIDINPASGAITVKRAGTVDIFGETLNTGAWEHFAIKIEKAIPALTIVGNNSPFVTQTTETFTAFDHGSVTVLPLVWHGNNGNAWICNQRGAYIDVIGSKPGTFTLTAHLLETEQTRSATMTRDMTFVPNTTTLEIDDISLTFAESLTLTLNAVTNSDAPVRYSVSDAGLRVEGNVLFISEAGSYTVMATVDSTNTHDAAIRPFTVTITPAEQRLTFLPLSETYFESGKAIPLYATSNNPRAKITFEILSGTASLNDTAIILPDTLVDTEIIVRALALSDTNYNAASAVQILVLRPLPSPEAPTLANAFVIGNRITMVPDSFNYHQQFTKKTKFAATYPTTTPKGIVKLKKSPVKTVGNLRDTHYSIEVKGKVPLLNKKAYNALRKTKTTLEILTLHNDSGAVQRDSILVNVQHKNGKSVSVDSVCVPALAPMIDTCCIGRFIDNATECDFLLVRLDHPGSKPKAWLEYKNNGKIAKIPLIFYNAKKMERVLGLYGACDAFCPANDHLVIAFKINPKAFAVSGSMELVLDNQNGLAAIPLILK